MYSYFWKFLTKHFQISASMWISMTSVQWYKATDCQFGIDQSTGGIFFMTNTNMTTDWNVFSTLLQKEEIEVRKS